MHKKEMHNNTTTTAIATTLTTTTTTITTTTTTTGNEQERLHNLEMTPQPRKNNANIRGVGSKAQIEGIGSWSPGQGEYD
jgi:hypothetical protein